MKEYRYDIEMSVPLGIRKGQMLFHINDNAIDGMLFVLGKSEPFSGTLTTDGKFEIYGNIITLIKTIPYRAVGIVSGKMLELEVFGEEIEFHITGKETNHE